MLLVQPMGSKSDFQKAIDLFESDNEQEAKIFFEKIPPEVEPEALVYLSMIYHNESSKNSNDFHAKNLLQKYAEIVRQKANSGDAKWRLRLAEMYLHGTMVPQSSDLAFEILEKLALEENASAQYAISEMYHTGYETNPDIAVSKRKYWLELSSAQGHPNAEFELAELLLADESCSPENLLKATELLNSASSKGNWQATAFLKELNSKNRS